MSTQVKAGNLVYAVGPSHTPPGPGDIHTSAAEALRVFATRALRRRNEAERAREHADAEVVWAIEQIKALKGAP